MNHATPDLLYRLSANAADFRAAVQTLQPADIAEALKALRPTAAARVLAALPFEIAVHVFDEPELELQRAGIVARLDDAAAAPLIEAMSADQRADLFRELRPAQRTRLLELLTPEARAGLSELLQYPPETAGGIMTTEFVGVPSNWTVDQVLQHIRVVAKSKETVYAIYVLDPATNALGHVVSLRELVLADPATPVKDVGGARSLITVNATMDREEVGRLIGKYNLLAVPVVDERRHVLGIVTVDDIIDALTREGTEDVQKLGGMEALDMPYTKISFLAMIKKRAGWLCALFVSEMLTATAMQHFEGELAKAVVLTLFIPLIMSSGGNSGSQATSLIIRAIALKEVPLRDWWRVAMREFPTGLVLGSILGVIGIVRIALWQQLHLYDYGTHWPLLAVTVGGALVGVVTFGSLAGSMLPFLLKRLNFDPASASAPFVATLVDVTGLVIYFTVAVIVLRGTLL